MRILVTFLSGFLFAMIGSPGEAIPLSPEFHHTGDYGHHYPAHYEQNGYHNYDSYHHYPYTSSTGHGHTADCNLHEHSPSPSITHEEDPNYHYYHPYNTNEVLIKNLNRQQHNYFRNPVYRPTTLTGTNREPGVRPYNPYRPPNRFYTDRYGNNNRFYYDATRDQTPYNRRNPSSNLNYAATSGGTYFS